MRTRSLIWLLALAPLFHAFVFWTFVLRARLALGYWPYPYHPDPKTLGFGLHHTLVTLSPAVMFTSVVMTLVLAAAFYRPLQRDRGRPLLAALVAIVGVAGLLLWARFDPGQFLAWFAD